MAEIAKKKATYGRYRVQHFWLIDAIAKTLEVLRLKSGVDAGVT
jgi:Uma2 family endonuclease